MSYILDALKKSEQERGHGSAPGVQTVHSSSINYHNEKKHYWPYILIAAVLLNFMAVLYFIFDKDNTAIISQNNSSKEVQHLSDNEQRGGDPAQTNVATEKDNTVLDSTSRNADKPSAVVVAKAQQKSRYQPKEPEAFTPAIEIEEPVADIISYHDLPDTTKAQLPAIIISAHVYSSNPAQRSIVINNNFLEEGEYIIDDLVLYEITPEGAILDYHGTLFSYGAVSSWQ